MVRGSVMRNTHKSPPERTRKEANVIVLQDREIDPGSWGETHTRLDRLWQEVARIIAAENQTTIKAVIRALLLSGIYADFGPPEADRFLLLAERELDGQLDDLASSFDGGSTS